MPIGALDGTGDDRGETLVELLVALVILGIAVVAIVGGLASSVLISDVHRKQAQAGVIVRDYAEALQAAVTASQLNYAACPAAPGYAPSAAALSATGFTVPSGYTAAASVQYWDGSSTFGSCPAGGDTGLQRVTLTVSSDDGRARQALEVVLRKPCRPTDAACS
jgi:type II secretory pathway pseudopilin PulG